MSKYILEFEKSIKLIDDKIRSLIESSSNSGINIDDTINTLNAQLEREKKLSCKGNTIYKMY